MSLFAIGVGVCLAAWRKNCSVWSRCCSIWAFRTILARGNAFVV